MSKLPYRKDTKNVDLHDIYELIELGLNKEEIAEEYNISKDYVRKMIEDYYDDL